MKQWTIRRRVLLSFAAILAIMIVMAGVAFWYLKDIDRERAELESDYLTGLTYGGQLAAATVTSHAVALAHVLSIDPAVMERLQVLRDAAVQDIEQSAGAYETTIRRNDDRVRFERVRRELVPYLRVQVKALQLSTALENDAARALASGELHDRFEELQRSVQAIANDNGLRANASGQSIGAAVGAALRAVVFSGALALLLALLCGLYLLRAITRPLGKLLAAVHVIRTGDFSGRLTFENDDEFKALADGFNRMCDELVMLVGQVQESGTQVNSSVSEIAATSQQQQATATEIAATTTEIGATSREISATSRELVRTMTDVAKVAEHSATLAGSGHTGLVQMESTMRRVMDATGSINAKLAVLNEKAGNIGQVVTTITKVADQTNLLSLNAAIEAEKAGEYGRGFAVVSAEIRRLADQTAVATYDIEQMVKAIQSAVSAGVMGMDRFSEEVRRGMSEVQQVALQLSEVIQQVQALAPRCEAVNEGMQAQAIGAEQITESLVQLSEAAQQTVESLRQSNLTIGKLNHVASALRMGISRFKLEA